MSWALAVDGGNTKTVAVLARDDGRVRAVGRAGCSDMYTLRSPERALDAIAAAVGAALSSEDVDAADIGAAAFSLAGADWPEDFALLERALPERLGLRVPALVVNDALGALRSGSPDWTGIAVVAGTYNAVGARHPDGRIFHLGFWPDGAGGRHLAEDGLRAVYRADVDMGPATALTGRALEEFGADDAIGLLHAFTRRGGLPPGSGDRFAPHVLDAADGGDAVARAIVAEKGRLLGLQARVSAARLELPLDGTRAVLTGRVFEHPSPLLAEAVMAELPGAVALRGGPPPVAGALLLALDRIGATVAPAGVESLAGMPADEGSARWAAYVSSG